MSHMQTLCKINQVSEWRRQAKKTEHHYHSILPVPLAHTSNLQAVFTIVHLCVT
jgi:hypothetical protein